LAPSLAAPARQSRDSRRKRKGEPAPNRARLRAECFPRTRPTGLGQDVGRAQPSPAAAARFLEGLASALFISTHPSRGFRLLLRERWPIAFLRQTIANIQSHIAHVYGQRFLDLARAHPCPA